MTMKGVLFRDKKERETMKKNNNNNNGKELENGIERNRERESSLQKRRGTRSTIRHSSNNRYNKMCVRRKRE